MPARATFSRVVPILHIFDVDKARRLYADYLGFTVDWEHRSNEGAPLYMQVSRSGPERFSSDRPLAEATPADPSCARA